MLERNSNAKNLYIDRLQDFSCGICVLDTTQNLSIIYANEPFYNMANITVEEMRLKYGNCLDTLLSAENIKKLHLHLQEDESFEMEIYIKNSICIHSVFNCAHMKDKSVVYMLCFDMTSYKRKSVNLDNLLLKLDYIFNQVKCDVFEYEKSTGIITYSSANHFFEKDDAGAKLPYYFLDSHQISEGYINDIINCFDSIDKTSETISCEIKVKIKNKNEKWVRMILDKHVSDEGCVLCILIDISAEKEATKKYFEEMLFYHAFLSERNAYGHFDITDDRVLIMGGLWNLYNEVIKTKKYSEIYNEFIDKVVHSEDRQHYKETMDCQTILDSYNKGIMHTGCEFRRIVDQNKMVWMKISIHIIKNPLNQHIMALMYIENIDRAKKHLLELTFRDENDALTGVYNKKSAELKIKEYLLLRNMKKDNILLIIDIDELKILNKRHGFVKGDDVLKSIAKQSIEIFNNEGLVGRFGGDEFIILLKDCSDTKDVIQRIEKAKKKIQKDLKMLVTFCVGMTVVTGSDSYEYAFQKVISALVEAKSQGKNHTVVYQDEMLSEELKSLQKRNIQEYEDTFLKTSDNDDLHSMIDTVMGEKGEIAYFVDPESLNLLSGNQAFYSRLGKSKSQCVGRKCYELMHHRSTPCPFCKKENWTDDKFFMYRDYNKVLQQEFLIKNKLIEVQNRTVLLAIAVDLSNKSFIDSIENGTTENNYLLNGLEHMQNSSSLDETFVNALETISNFFRSKTVRFWELNKEDEKFYLSRKWFYPETTTHYSKQECQYISDWLTKKTKKGNLLRIESQDFMLCESVEMYHIMNKYEIENQVWYMMGEEDDKIGFVEVDNVSINYQNDTFLKSFVGFLQSEWGKRKLYNEIIYDNYHDKLTGLMNRNSYDEFIRRYDKDKIDNISIIFMNINQMTEINNENGTPYGDNILTGFSDIVKTVCDDQNAYIFRLNGDEFMIVHQNTDVQIIEKCIEKIQEVIHEMATFTVSIGYSWDNLEKNFTEQVTVATQSMEIHKQRYYDNLENKVDSHSEELSMMVSAIENREFAIFLQAKVNSETGITFGAEALIRYIHKDFGVIAPGKFISTVEKKNMIRYIDLFVFEEVCKCLDRWKKEGLFCPVISLNFSRKTLLEDRLIDILNETVNKYQVDKKNIEIEITEGDADVGATVVYQIVRRIRQAGYAVSLDDFGTNYTNLSILSELDFDTLKLDRSLIYSLNEQEKNRIILKNMIQMCEQLGVKVIAEGVETVEQRDTLMQLGCVFIQGYLYSKPIPVGEFEEQFIKNHE